MNDVMDFLEDREAIQMPLSTVEAAKLKSLIFRLISLWHDSVNYSKEDSFHYNEGRYYTWHNQLSF